MTGGYTLGPRRRRYFFRADLENSETRRCKVFILPLLPSRVFLSYLLNLRQK